MLRINTRAIILQLIPRNSTTPEGMLWGKSFGSPLRTNRLLRQVKRIGPGVSVSRGKLSVDDGG
jgi:hypothetical protein